jgi:hypothetical protein
MARLSTGSHFYITTRLQPLKEAGLRSLDCAYPLPVPGWCQAMGKPQDPTPGVGECIPGAGSRVLGSAGRPGPSGSQALGHPGIAGCCRRAENGVGACRLDLAWGQREDQEELRLGPTGTESLACQQLAWLGSRGWGHRETFHRRLDGWLFKGKPSPLLPMKRGRPWF